MVPSTRCGFIAEDLEESVAAPGSGEAVFGIGCDIIIATIDATITVSVIYNNPPHMPELP